MTEHLFKLKKDDGETVGYLLLKCGAIFQKTRYKCDEWTCNPEFAFEWATAHPFIAKDKNGKDVFAEDKVKSWYPCGRLIADDLIAQYSHPAASNEYNSANMNDIELIEDKDND